MKVALSPNAIWSPIPPRTLRLETATPMTVSTIACTFGQWLQPWPVFLEEGREIEVTVADTGPGIAPADQPHVFEPFYTTKESKGTGLGLSVSYFIITNNHKGQMEVHSNQDQGTCFTRRCA